MYVLNKYCCNLVSSYLLLAYVKIYKNEYSIFIFLFYRNSNDELQNIFNNLFTVVWKIKQICFNFDLDSEYLLLSLTMMFILFLFSVWKHFFEWKTLSKSHIQPFYRLEMSFSWYHKKDIFLYPLILLEEKY